ncbi:mCG145141, partial [Mus musculus]
GRQACASIKLVMREESQLLEIKRIWKVKEIQIGTHWALSVSDSGEDLAALDLRDDRTQRGKSTEVLQRTQAFKGGSKDLLKP